MKLIDKFCVMCGSVFNKQRYDLGYRICLDCGEDTARKHKHCIVPLHKSNYVPVFNRNDLIGINSKGGIVK